MGKLTMYLIMMSGLTLLFFFTGLIQETPNAILLKLLLSPQNIAATQLGTLITAAIIGIGVAAAAGLANFYVINLQAVLRVSITIYLFNTFLDFIKIFDVLLSVNGVLALLIFSPLMVVYILTIIEFFETRDN